MKTKMPVRVAVIITGLGVGGAELRQLTVVRSIDREKVCIDFYCLFDEDNSLIPEFVNLGYKVHVLKVFDYTKHFVMRVNYFSIFQLIRMLRKGRYDIVHTQLPHANTVGRIAAEFAGIKQHIATICNMEERFRWQTLWDNLLGKRSCKIMCISESVLDFERQYTLFDPAKYIVIYNGIDSNKFSRVHTKCSVSLPALNTDSKPFVLCSVARLHPQKDFPTMLQAFAIVLEKYAHTFLLIVGDGEEMTALKSLTMHLGLIEKVLFLGPRTDIPDVLTCVDLFVSSSLYEGFGNTIIEAMSMEVPVIATDIPPYREIIRDNYNGVLVPVKQPISMSKAICRLIDDEKKRLEYGARGRKTVLSRFSHDIMISRLEKLYQQLGT